MCIGGGPSIPAPPPLPPAPPPPPKETDPVVKKAREDNRQRAALAGGRALNIGTSAQGLNTAAPTAKKTLLGS